MTGITPANVATREAQRQVIADANLLKDEQARSHRSEIEAGLFKRLQSALLPNAPLLLHGLKNDHKQPAFAKRHMGSTAFKAIEQLGQIAAMLPGEDSTHDAELMRLVFKPMSNDATPDQFSLRISKVLKDHIPYLERPFPTQEKFGS